MKEAVKTVKHKLQAEGQNLRKKFSGPMTKGCRPELDTSSLLSAEKANYYQNLIGVLRWAVELSRIDIQIEVALLSSYLAAPCTGHLEQVLHMFAYLKRFGRSKLVFDSTDPVWEESRFQNVDWEEFYPDAEEPNPHKMPEPRGHEVLINTFVDADHAGNMLTRRSHAGILIFLN